MARYYKKLKAGRYCAVTAYSRIGRNDCPKARSEKRNHASKAQQNLNSTNSRIAFTAIIALNFADSKTAFFATLTFDDAHYPSFERKSLYWNYVVKQADNYIVRLRRLAKKRGAILKTAYSPGIGEKGRWHLHMLIDGVTAEDIRDAWGRGDVDMHHLYADSHWLISRDWYNKKTKNVNPVAIAKYMIGNANCRNVGQHPWHVSRSCTRPKAERATLIDDNCIIDFPDNADPLDKKKESTMYSTFIFLEYIEARELAEIRSHKRKTRNRKLRD